MMDATGRCRFAVIDADTDDGLDRLWQIQEQLVTQDIISYVERSRRGGHLWVFFTEPAPASQVRAWLLPFCPADMEFYPKQDEGPKGMAHLIRLPLGASIARAASATHLWNNKQLVTWHALDDHR